MTRAIDSMRITSDLLLKIASPLHPFSKKEHNPSITKMALWAFSAIYAFSQNTRTMIYRDLRVQVPRFLPLIIPITIIGAALILKRIIEKEEERVQNRS